MKVVVAGGAGFIGAAVSERLASDGHDVTAVDCHLGVLYPQEVSRERAERLNQQGVRTLMLDLRRDSVDDLVHEADVIINEAAMPGLSPSWTDFQTYQDCNLLVVQRLLDAVSRRPGAHFVQASTSSVYGEVADGDESMPVRPVSPYGVTKLAAENLVAAYRRTHGVSATVLRYFSVYGPGQRPDMAYAIICDRLTRGLPISVTGDGRQSRTNTYIDDVVAATIAAAQRRPDGETMNVCGHDEIALLDAIEILAGEIGTRPVIEFVDARAGDQRRTRGDAGLAKRVLAWEACVGIDEGQRRQAAHAASALEV